MLVECKQCGAPLDVSPSASIVRCSYCGGHNRVRSMRTIAEQAPAGWVPPPQWTPRNAMAPLPYRAPPKQTSLGALVLVLVLVVVALSLCPFALMPLFFLLS